MGCSPWGRKESDTTERLHFLTFFSFFSIINKVLNRNKVVNSLKGGKSKCLVSQRQWLEDSFYSSEHQHYFIRGFGSGEGRKVRELSLGKT